MSDNPQDRQPWQLVSLGDCVSEKPAYGANAPAVEQDPTLPRYIRITDISDAGRLFEHDRKSLSWESADGNMLEAGDLAIARSGGTVGKTYLHRDKEPVAYAGYLIKFRPNKKIIEPDFLFAITQSPLFIHWMARMKRAGAQPNVNAKEYSSFKFPLPPVAIQRKIAEILRTWDDTLEKLTTLRAIKKKQFTGLCQSLLGRGGDFPDAWEHRPLAVVSTRIRRTNNGADSPVMTISAKSGFLMQANRFNRDMAGRSVERYIELHEGEFAYNKGNSLTAQYGCIFALDRPSALVPFVYFCFSLNEKLCHRFYQHLFAAGALNRQLSRLINSGVRNDGLLNLNIDDFFGCQVPVPPRTEQEKIAMILTDAKQEIKLLDNEIETYSMQKHGLAQKLLTGEWRIAC